MKFYAIPKTDGGVAIMQIPPYAVRIDAGDAELLNLKAGVFFVVRDQKWTPLVDIAGDKELLYANPADEIAKWAPAHRAEVMASAIREVSSSDIPTDRTFRNAWTDGGAKIDVDMAKAREIHKSALRQIRTPLLAALDTEYMRADEAGDIAAKQRIVAEKNALRDVTDDPAIAAAKTPDELKAVMPDVLK